MTEKKTYWITNTAGEYARVEGADERDRWVGVHGWTEADEPTRDEVQVHVTHVEGLTGKIPYAATKGEWAGLGWTPGAPPEPRDLTKDPVLTDRPAPSPVAEPTAELKTPAAAGGEKIKE